MSDPSRMPFGRFKGRPIREVPAAYLDWLAYQDWITRWPAVLDYIDRNRDLIDFKLRQRTAARKHKSAGKHRRRRR